MKTRNGFVSNSSSSSFVVISHGGATDKSFGKYLAYNFACEENNWSERTLTVPYSLAHLPSGHFGWDTVQYTSFEDRLAFACLQACYHDGVTEETGEPIVGEWHKMIGEVLMIRIPNLMDVQFRISTREGHNISDGYIDHQSAYPNNCEMFATADHLRAFLFNDGSYVQGGNDNG